MDATGVRAPSVVASPEVERLRELLERWSRLEREVLTHEEMAELYADTKRTLLGLHAGSPPHAPSVQVPSAGT
jgi:hypothetical protein